SRFIIENRDVLFAGGDPRISSLALWHCVEEFEHRNCAIDVFNEIVGSHLYRLRQISETRRHLRETGDTVTRAFRRLVADGKIESTDKGISDGTSRRSRLRLYAELFSTLLPWHKPDHLKQPQWVTQWMSDYTAGKPMEVAYEPPN
ncbi:MAG TPA: metal-dependent hydrolase, partial [Candidatus Binataceae bacterium]|nr:metal-dependent hydrolase [Candidatus Binataceae bacterium]